jgi:hypothetical protein
MWKSCSRAFAQFLVMLFTGISSVHSSTSKDLGAAVDHYTEEVRSVWQTIIRFSPVEYRDRLAAAEFKITTDDVPFSFFGGGIPNGNSVVVVSIGGVRALNLCANAMYLSTEYLKDNGWWLRYFLYLRHRFLEPDGTFVPDPLMAMGVDSNSAPVEVLQHATWTYLNALTFLLAHEAGHVALRHDLRPRLGESTRERLARARVAEGDADHFALEVMKNMRALPTGAALAFGWHLLIFQRSNSSLGSDHPLDSDRIQKVSEYVKEHLQEFDLGQHSTKEIMDVFENGSKLAQQVESGELSFSDLDQQSRGITLESLRKDDSK